MFLKRLWNACGRALWRLKQGNVILSVSPAGILDKRVMDELVPWRAVLAIRQAKFRYTRVIPSGGLPQAPSVMAVPAEGTLVEIDFDACYLSGGGDWTLPKVLTLKVKEMPRLDSDTIYKMCKFYWSNSSQ
jgi:hypothetical protein